MIKYALDDPNAAWRKDHDECEGECANCYADLEDQWHILEIAAKRCFCKACALKEGFLAEAADDEDKESEEDAA